MAWKAALMRETKIHSHSTSADTQHNFAQIYLVTHKKQTNNMITRFLFCFVYSFRHPARNDDHAEKTTTELQQQQKWNEQKVLQEP